MVSDVWQWTFKYLQSSNPLLRFRKSHTEQFVFNSCSMWIAFTRSLSYLQNNFMGNYTTLIRWQFPLYIHNRQTNILTAVNVLKQTFNLTIPVQSLSSHIAAVSRKQHTRLHPLSACININNTERSHVIQSFPFPWCCCLWRLTIIRLGDWPLRWVTWT